MTKPLRGFKIFISVMIIGLLLLSISLWLQTPDLFIYFNQAFCAH
ncbi:hypothetical protein EC844_11574 [Acinetobacter calcoaceticus]|uniref:Signal pepetide n=1 Tax=Acinetobacter calcoaceticus TaxID=471 RepID=A0A4R1XNL2_ACICA|nr:hypothetical protein EC844_11574 [Acinetobacter calcoaceticus]